MRICWRFCRIKRKCTPLCFSFSFVSVLSVMVLVVRILLHDTITQAPPPFPLPVEEESTNNGADPFLDTVIDDDCEIEDTNWPNKTIIVITPTYRRRARMADLTRMANTLSLIKDLHWIVIEDGDKTVPQVERLLERTGLPFVYLHTVTPQKIPRRGWAQRDLALDYLQEEYANYSSNAVVYFADDDNSYNIRMFDEYVRRVKKLGVWAVQSVGQGLIEAPDVAYGSLMGFHSNYAVHIREFAIDMAGFGVNLKIVNEMGARFRDCVHKSPENCFLLALGLHMYDVEPFGWNPKEILVFHTKTVVPFGGGMTYYFFVEVQREEAQIIRR